MKQGGVSQHSLGKRVSTQGVFAWGYTQEGCLPGGGGLWSVHGGGVCFLPVP